MIEHEPDYVTAKRELAALITQLGYTMTSEPSEPRKGWDGDRYAGHVHFALKHPQSGQAYGGTYSAGSLHVIDWARENTSEARKACGWPRLDISELKSVRASMRKLTIYQAEILERLCKVWRPSVVDVVASLCMDVQDYQPDASFREWVEDSGMTWQHPADALECFEAIKAEARFLRRTAGTKYDALIALAGRL